MCRFSILVLYWCTDLTLSQARWSWRGSNSLVPRREPSEEDQEGSLFISCSEDTASPLLEVKACRFVLSNQTEGPHETRWGFALSGRPSEAAIYQWMEQQIAAETATGFEAAMDRLLLRVVRQPQAGMLAKWQVPLLSELLMMRCMWKVWNCKQLFCRPSPESQPFPLDVRTSTIQDSLQSFAAQAISERERKILQGTQQLFFEKKDKDTAEVAVVKWLLLWQLMLLYRRSMGWMLAQAQPFSLSGSFIVSKCAAPGALTEKLGMPGSTRRHEFLKETGLLFEAIVVIYSVEFQVRQFELFMPPFSDLGSRREHHCSRTTPVTSQPGNYSLTL